MQPLELWSLFMLDLNKKLEPFVILFVSIFKISLRINFEEGYGIFCFVFL